MNRSIFTQGFVIPRRKRVFRPRTDGLEGRLLLTAGALDITDFGAPKGYVLAGAQSAVAVGLQSDGNIVVAGNVLSNSQDFRLARISANGSSVLSTNVDFAGRDDNASRLAVLDDDSIIVAGEAGNVEGRPGKGGKITYYPNRDFGLVKFRPDGSVDTDFGVNGKVSTNISTYTTTGLTNRVDHVHALGIQPDDGKIVVGGDATTGVSTMDAVLVRYNPDGSLDDGSISDSTPGDQFGVGGVIQYTLAGYTTNSVWDLSIYTGNPIDPADDRILTLEAPWNPSPRKYAVQISSYRLDGTLDTSFGTNGRAIVTDPGSLGCWDMAVDADGSILVTGYYDPALSVSGDNDAFLLRLTATGARDSSFGTSGLLVWDAGSGYDDSHAVAIQPDGMIVVAGRIEQSTVGSAYLARFDTHGTFDVTFGAAFGANDPFTNSSSSFSDVILQPDGKIVAVGAATTQVTSRTKRNDFLVARFLGDTAFAASESVTVSSTQTNPGKAPLVFLPSAPTATDLAIDLLAGKTRKSRSVQRG